MMNSNNAPLSPSSVIPSKDVLQSIEKEKEDRIKREKLIQELFTSEKAHVESLNFLVAQYLKPLKDILTPTNISEIFSNLELIRNWNNCFFAGLEVHLETNVAGSFGSLFEEMVPLLRQMYAQYTENYENAMTALDNLKKANKKFHTFLENKSKEGGKDLLSYLYLPIQRMIAYDSLLKDIIQYTPKEHTDYPHLLAALRAVREAAENADARAKQRKNIDKVIAIQNMLTETSNLAVPHRRFIFEGHVLLVRGTGGNMRIKDRQLFLFNDLLLCTKHKNKRQQIVFTEPLETLKINNFEDTPEIHFAFRLLTPANEYVIIANEDKVQWMSHISDTLKELKDSKTTFHSSSEDSVNHQHEPLSRSALAAKIISWSKSGDTEEVMRDIKRLAHLLESK